MRTASILSIASVVSERFPSLTLDQCVYAARRALAAECASNPADYAVALAGESIEAQAVRSAIRGEYDVDCDSSYSAGLTTAKELRDLVAEIAGDESVTLDEVKRAMWSLPYGGRYERLTSTQVRAIAQKVRQ